MAFRVRDATLDDVDAVSAVSGLPTDAAREIIQRRTVKVAVPESDAGSSVSGADDRDDGSTGETSTPEDAAGAPSGETSTDATPAEDDETSAEGSIGGMVAFDADAEALHVTVLAGDRAAMDRLVDEPLTVAAEANLPAEVVVPTAEERVVAAVTDAGFEDDGQGPTFAGEPTRRYRHPPPDG